MTILPRPANAREELRKLTAEAHVAGSPEDHATAIYVRDQMRSFGLASDIKEYQVLLSYPRTPSIVELSFLTGMAGARVARAGRTYHLLHCEPQCGPSSWRAFSCPAPRA